MSGKGPSPETLVRKAFGLLLELRGQRDAASLLTQAVACLKLLLEAEGRNTSPLLVSVRLVRIPRA